MLDTKYAFITAYLKGEEAKVVTSDHINRMSKLSSIQDVLAIIKDTDIGSYLEQVAIRTFDDLDEYLWKYFGECLERLEWFKLVPSEIVKVVKAYIVKYDVLNIKAALQRIWTGKKVSVIPLGVIHDCGLLDELGAVEDVDSIIKLLTECKLGNYASVLKQGRMDEAKPSLATEAKLDEEYYRNLLNMTKTVKDGLVLARAFSIIIDLTNLQLINRAIIKGISFEAGEFTISGGYMISGNVAKDLISLKLTDIPSRLENTQYRDIAQEVANSYDRTKSITSVDEVIDRYKLSLVKEILSPRVLSPLVVAWYLVLKELEIRNLRLILKAMFDNIPLEEIRQYVVLSS